MGFENLTTRILRGVTYRRRDVRHACVSATTAEVVMRYSFGFLCVCALGLVPLTASAQTGEAATTSEPNLQESAPSAEPAPEEPALQLELSPAGVELVPSPPRTVDGYTLEQMNVRVRRAGFGLGGSGVALVIGALLVASGISGECGWGGDVPREKCDRLAYAGAALAGGGAAGMIATGILLGVRKRDRRRLQEAHYGRPHRAQWDLTQSRLVF